MKVICPKCDKKIIEADIEAEKAYCRSCMEWVVLKEDNTNEEYTIFGELTLKESRYVGYSLILSKFLVFIVIFFSIIYGLTFLLVIIDVINYSITTGRRPNL
jgi:hypothetical protein